MKNVFSVRNLGYNFRLHKVRTVEERPGWSGRFTCNFRVHPGRYRDNLVQYGMETNLPKENLTKQNLPKQKTANNPLKTSQKPSKSVPKTF